MHKDPSTTYITFILVETNQPEAGFIFTLSEFALVLSCGFFLSRCSESCFESRCFPLPVQIRNSVTKPTSWIIHRFKKQICKRLCSRCGHGCERGGVEERGGFKFLHSFFWFEVKLNQRRAELRSHGRSCPRTVFITRGFVRPLSSCKHIHIGSCVFFFRFCRRVEVAAAESCSPNRDWPLELVLKMEAVIEKECSALGGLFQTVIGDMKVSETSTSSSKKDKNTLVC